MEEKKKSNVGLIICLVIIILGLVGYICYDKFFDKKEPAKTDEKEKANTAEENYEAYYQILNERMPRTMCYEFSELYQESGFKVSEMSQKLFFLWIFSNIHGEKEVTMGEINSIVSNLVLNGGNVTLNDIKNNSTFNKVDDLELGSYEWGSIANISYTIIDDSTIKAKNTVLDCEPTSFYLKKIIGKNETDEKLELKVKIALVETDLGLGVEYGKKASDAAKYPDMKYNEHALETVKTENVNWDLYDTYTITFQKVNNNYYFESVVLN